jgi:hypothetical protein
MTPPGNGRPYEPNEGDDLADQLTTRGGVGHPVGEPPARASRTRRVPFRPSPLFRSVGTIAGRAGLAERTRTNAHNPCTPSPGDAPEWEVTAELNGARFTVCMTAIEEAARGRYRTHAKIGTAPQLRHRSSPTSRWVVVA